MCIRDRPGPAANGNRNPRRATATHPARSRQSCAGDPCRPGPQGLCGSRRHFDEHGAVSPQERIRRHRHPQPGRARACCIVCIERAGAASSRRNVDEPGVESDGQGSPMSGSADAEAKIIDTIYRGACDSVELSRAIAQIAEYFESPGVLLGELDQAQPERQFAIGARTIDQEYFARYAEHAELDPAPRAFAALAVGTASITDRIFSDSFLRRNVFLNEFLVPRGVNGALACPLLSESGRFALIAVQQGVNRRSYDDDDIVRLERLTPHLTRALQIRRLFLQSEARGKALESVIDRNETGMVGLRGDGPALFVNRAARAVAAASCLPYMTRPIGQHRPSGGSLSCCTFHSEPPRCCRQSLKA